MDTAELDGVPHHHGEQMKEQQELDVTEPQPASYPFKFTIQLEAQDQTVEISGRLSENAKNELIKMILEARSVQT